jgi:hypothetical protein
MTNIYSKTETNNLLSAKEANLTFSSPLTRTTNTIGINLSSYSTTGNDASYLLKTGGTMTGNLNIEKLNPIVSIKSSAENETSILYLSTPLNITSGLKTAIIAEGVSAWGRSKLHFCLNDNQTDNSTSQNASVSHARMTILPSGNIGINNTAPGEKLDVSGNIKTTGNIDCGGGIAINGANAFYETGSVTDTNETNTYINFKWAGAGNDWCYLRQIGGNNTYKLAFDFHDDNNDARFCIRSVQSAGAEPDNMVEVFTVDNGNTTMTGSCTATSFSGSGANLTNLPLSSYSTTGNDASYLLKTGGTLTGTLNGTTINATTALQEAGTNLTSKYLQLSGGSMTANANITLSGTGTFTGIHSGNGAALTNLPLSAYSTTGNDASYVLKTGSTMTGLLSATTINTTGNIGIGITNPPAPLSIGTPDVLGSDGFIFIGKYKASVGNRCFKIGYDDGFNMCFGDFGATISATSWKPMQFNINWDSGNVGIGTSGQTQRLNVNGTTYFNGASTVNGTLTATTFSGSGANLTNLPLSSYSTTGNDASYVLKSGSTMTGGLNFNNIISTKVISLYDASPANNFQYVGIGANNGLVLSCFATGDAFKFNVGATTTTSTEVMRIQGNGKVGIGTNDPKTLLHLRGAKPATLKIETNNSDIGEVCCIEFGIPAFASNRCAKITSTTYGGDKADIRFLTSANAGTTDVSVRMTIKEDGNVGIGANSPNNILQVGDGARLRISNGVNDYSLIGTKDVDDTTNTRIVISGNTRGGYEGQIQYIATAGHHIFYTSATNERMRISNNGNVGIGTDTPRSLLNIKGTNAGLTIMSQGGTGATSQLNLSTYDHTTFLSPCSLIATDNGTFGSTFQIKQKTSGANANAQFTSLSIDASGNSSFIGSVSGPIINATSNFNINSVNINNWLFNNNGVLHEANQNFNNIGKYGYTFINGLGSAPLNGPATGDTQYYSWYIGLGSEYPAFFGTVGSYGMQFAIGRSDTNPKLCIRRNQNNSWTAWQGITAEQATTATTATSLTSGDKTISGSLTVNGSITVQDGSAINFGASGADGRIYRTGGQVYIEGDDYIYFKSNFNTGTSGYFNQGTLYASSSLQSGGSLSVGTNASISGTLSGAVNVSRRAQFTFTPSQVLIGGLGLRYIHTINLNNYITGINSSVSGINRVFRITIWGESGDFGDSTNNVETMQFLIFMSFFGGINGGKRRIYQIINESNGSTISYSNAETVYYNGWNGTGGSAQKFCIIENIAGY